jgi:hypothetical protein
MKAALLLLAVAAGGVAGCADNDLSLSILEMEALTAPMCVAQATVTTQLPRGLLDAGAVTLQGYIAVPLVRNNQVSRITAAGGIEYNSIQVIGANVKLDVPAPADKLLTDGEKNFRWPASGGRLDPGGTAAMFIEAIPATVAKKLAPAVPQTGLLTVTAEVRPVGKATSDDITGGPLFFPIDICNGCIQVSLGTCPLPKGTVVQGAGCYPWQDRQAQCCTDATGNVLCGSAAPVATM